jgi:adenylate cyclase
VNIASRLNGLAGPGEIIISKSTYESTKNIALVKALPPQKIKGRSEFIEAFQVLDMIEKQKDG